MFRLALRQTEGLIGSILQLLGLDLAVPDHSTLSRRAETLGVLQPKVRASERKPLRERLVPPEAWSPTLAVGVDAFVPTDHVPEEVLRIGIHARLGQILRAGDAAALEALGDELEDRFGAAPEPLGNLLALARLSIRCRSLGTTRLEVGPNAVAATPRTKPEVPPPPLDLKNGRLLLRCESSHAEERLAAADRLLVAVAAPARKAA